MNEFSYESTIQKLEELVKKLESGDLPLEESLQAYEKGKQFIALCSEKLKEAQEKLQVVVQKENGSLEAAPFQFEKTQD
jgi:exodeoxyribonuclease VII small subunit